MHANMTTRYTVTAVLADSSGNIYTTLPSRMIRLHPSKMLCRLPNSFVNSDAPCAAGGGGAAVELSAMTRGGGEQSEAGGGSCTAKRMPTRNSAQEELLWNDRVVLCAEEQGGRATQVKTISVCVRGASSVR